MEIGLHGLAGVPAHLPAALAVRKGAGLVTLQHLSGEGLIVLDWVLRARPVTLNHVQVRCKQQQQ